MFIYKHYNTGPLTMLDHRQFKNSCSKYFKTYSQRTRIPKTSRNILVIITRVSISQTEARITRTPNRDRSLDIPADGRHHRLPYDTDRQTSHMQTKQFLAGLTDHILPWSSPWGKVGIFQFLKIK